MQSSLRYDFQFSAGPSLRPTSPGKAAASSIWFVPFINGISPKVACSATTR
jgi:hypothetical protein